MRPLVGKRVLHRDRFVRRFEWGPEADAFKGGSSGERPGAWSALRSSRSGEGSADLLGGMGGAGRRQEAWSDRRFADRRRPGAAVSRVISAAGAAALSAATEDYLPMRDLSAHGGKGESVTRRAGERDARRSSGGRRPRGPPAIWQNRWADLSAT